MTFVENTLYLLPFCVYHVWWWLYVWFSGLRLFHTTFFFPVPPFMPTCALPTTWFVWFWLCLLHPHHTCHLLPVPSLPAYLCILFPTSFGLFAFHLLILMPVLQDLLPACLLCMLCLPSLPLLPVLHTTMPSFTLLLSTHTFLQHLTLPCPTAFLPVWADGTSVCVPVDRHLCLCLHTHMLFRERRGEFWDRTGQTVRRWRCDHYLTFSDILISLTHSPPPLLSPLSQLFPRPFPSIWKNYKSKSYMDFDRWMINETLIYNIHYRIIPFRFQD